MLYSDNNSMFFSDNYIMSAIFFNYLLFKKGYHMHMKKSLYQTIQYLTDSSSDLLKNCKVTTTNGITIFTPDGVSSYNALWLRDFSYMVEYAGDCISNDEIIGCIQYAIDHRRADDGWMPDRIYEDGVTAYAAGVVGKPIGEANLDNTPFLIFTVHSLMTRLKPGEFQELFKKWEPYLRQGLNAIPLDKHGLVYNDPVKPHSPYGFTDTVAKTGSLYMESLLYWRACLHMFRMTSSPSDKELYLQRCNAIESSIKYLYHSDSHAFLAATDDCAQIDIWGIAYMLYINFPCTDEIKSDILTFLKDYYDRYVLHGQIRHLLSGEYWERLLIEIPHEEYQNGAYWATASGWVIWCLAQIDEKLAARTLYDVVSYFQKEGSFECINHDYQKLSSFVVSTTNVLGAARRLEQNKNFCDAFASITE